MNNQPIITPSIIKKTIKNQANYHLYKRKIKEKHDTSIPIINDLNEQILKKNPTPKLKNANWAKN